MAGEELARQYYDKLKTANDRIFELELKLSDANSRTAVSTPKQEKKFDNGTLDRAGHENKNEDEATNVKWRSQLDEAHRQLAAIGQAQDELHTLLDEARAANEALQKQLVTRNERIEELEENPVNAAAINVADIALSKSLREQLTTSNQQIVKLEKEMKIRGAQFELEKQRVEGEVNRRIENLKASLKRQLNESRAKTRAEVEQEMRESHSFEVQKLKQELEEQRKAPEEERETAVRQAVDHEKEKAMLQASHPDVSLAKVEIVRKAASETPGKTVREVWETANDPRQAPTKPLPPEPCVLPAAKADVLSSRYSEGSEESKEAERSKRVQLTFGLGGELKRKRDNVSSMESLEAPVAKKPDYGQMPLPPTPVAFANRGLRSFPSRFGAPSIPAEPQSTRGTPRGTSKSFERKSQEPRSTPPRGGLGFTRGRGRGQGRGGGGFGSAR